MFEMEFKFCFKVLTMLWTYIDVLIYIINDIRDQSIDLLSYREVIQ